MISVLGISAGLAKILLMPEERAFFSQVGLDETILIIFGLMQLTGTILFVILKTRRTGAAILGLTFGASTVVIFLNGQFAFGLLSFLPIILILLLTEVTQDKVLINS